jgi:hypothetical protein
MIGWGGPKDFDTPAPGFGAHPKHEIIELVGPHLRLSGTVSLLAFPRLADMLNNSRGYLRMTNAQLLRRNGDPTGLFVEELLVDQDEVSFVAQTAEEMSTETRGLADGLDRPLMERKPRQIVIFTPGHTLTGCLYMFEETDFENYIDSPDPKYVPMIEVTARSLADRRVISHFGLCLVNRSQISAASLLEHAGTAAETGVGVE